MFKQLFIFFKKIDKRRRAVIATGIITATVLVLTYIPYSQVFFFLPGLVLIIYLVSYLALLEDIANIEYFVLFVLPIYFTLSFILFYYLLPSRLLTRIPLIIILSVVIYALLLSENIFNIGVEKGLVLYRAAYSVANFLTLLIFFFVFIVLFSFRQPFWFNMILGGGLTWPLFFHAIWTASPKSVLEERIYKFATVLSVLLSASIFILNFLPVKANILAIYTSCIAYALFGITQEIIVDTAYKERLNGYVIVLAIMSFLFILAI